MLISPFTLFRLNRTVVNVGVGVGVGVGVVVLLLSAVIVLAANSFCGWCSGSDDDGGGVVCVCSVLESNGGDMWEESAT